VEFVEIVGDIREIETIAVGSRIRELDRLVESFGKGRWRKLKELRAVVCRVAVSALRSYTGTKLTA
jgi:hypothetical protein